MDMNGYKRRDSHFSVSNESMSDCSGYNDGIGDILSSPNKRVKAHDISSTELSHADDYGSTSVTSVRDIGVSSVNSRSSEDDAAPLEVAKLLKKLKLVPEKELTQDPKHWFHRLCNLLGRIIKERPRGFESSKLERLKRHLHCRENGKLNVSLVAASYLKIHPDIHEVQCPQSDNFPKYLPSPIRQRLFHGKFVPIRHIIYGEALILGIACHKMDYRKLPSDPYPLNFKVDSPPQEFVQDIQKPDIIRALTTHSITLSFRFPRLAARMHHLIRHMWILLYQEDMCVKTAMDLYDAYFVEFENSLCSLTLIPMESFPASLIEKVLNNNQNVSGVS